MDDGQWTMGKPATGSGRQTRIGFSAANWAVAVWRIGVVSATAGILDVGRGFHRASPLLHFACTDASPAPRRRFAAGPGLVSGQIACRLLPTTLQPASESVMYLFRPYSESSLGLVRV